MKTEDILEQLIVWMENGYLDFESDDPYCGVEIKINDVFFNANVNYMRDALSTLKAEPDK